MQGISPNVQRHSKCSEEGYTGLFRHPKLVQYPAPILERSSYELTFGDFSFLKKACGLPDSVLGNLIVFWYKSRIIVL